MNSVVIDGKVYNEKELVSQGLRVTFKSGDNNTIVIESPYKFTNFNITITGEDNSVWLKPGCEIMNTYIGLNMKMNGIKIRIGKNFICKGANVSASNDGDEIVIGDNCQFDDQIYIATQDGHTIYNLETRNILNQGKHIIIGNTVYLGYKTVIMKNVVLGNYVTVMPCSVVTKSFPNDNLQIAGHPAVVIRENIVRDKNLISKYKKRIYNE